MKPDNLATLGVWDGRPGRLNVIIETPKGSRNKFDYDAHRQLFELGKLLPRGMTFPFDFGFIPSTRGEDGDPLDVLVLMDEPAFPGCLIRCRVIGVIEGKQTNAKKKAIRNDRLIAVAEESHEHRKVRRASDLPAYLIQEIEHFFAAYHDLDNHTFKASGCCGPRRAAKLVHKGAKRFERKSKRKSAERSASR